MVFVFRTRKMKEGKKYITRKNCVFTETSRKEAPLRGIEPRPRR